MADNTDGSTSNKGVSRDAMLGSFLTDETLNNVTRKGTDGVTVMANSYLLGARCQVFRQMFFGSFRVAKSPVELGFHSSVLKAVVEYILMDSVGILNCKKPHANDKPAIDFQYVQSFVSLVEAASYFDLPGLGKCATKTILRLLEDWPALSFPILQACNITGPTIPQQLLSSVVDHVRTFPFEEITVNEVSCLSDEVLEDILKDSEMEMTEYELFQFLNLWATSGDPHPMEEARLAKAKDLCKHISLEKIHPEHLSTTVTSSGLVDSEQLLEAYKYQALAGADKKIISQNVFISPRTGLWTTRIINSVKRDPAAIKVEGAGSNAVNGVYVRDGMWRRHCKYTMKGYNEGDPCVFWLCSTGWGGVWRIAIADEMRVRNDVFHNLYYARGSSNSTGHRHNPPCSGWEACQGIGPVPTLLFNFRSQSTPCDDPTT